MSIFSKIFKRKKKEPPAPGPGTAQVGLTGRELLVNPTASASLARLEGRLGRVNAVIESGKWRGTEREEEFVRIKRRLEMLITIQKETV